MKIRASASRPTPKPEPKPAPAPEPSSGSRSDSDATFVFSDGGKRLTYGGRVYVRVFQEDEVLKNDPTAPKIHSAFHGFTGAPFAETSPDLRQDNGDSFTDVYGAQGAIVIADISGSTLYLDEDRLPYAALFGSPWTFEDWKRIGEGFRAMRDPDPEFNSSHRLVAQGDLASRIAAVFQNDHPMTEAEIAETLRWLERWDLQLCNVTDELRALSANARRRLEEAKTKVP